MGSKASPRLTLGAVESFWEEGLDTVAEAGAEVLGVFPDDVVVLAGVGVDVLQMIFTDRPNDGVN
jgi:hypothetical protein